MNMTLEESNGIAVTIVNFNMRLREANVIYSDFVFLVEHKPIIIKGQGPCLYTWKSTLPPLVSYSEP